MTHNPLSMLVAEHLITHSLCSQVTHLRGLGSITGANEVTVAREDGTKEVVKTKNILIATGSEPMPFPGVEVGSIPFPGRGACGFCSIPFPGLATLYAFKRC